MLGPTYVDFTRYFSCTCWPDHQIFCVDFEIWQALRKESKMDKTESQVAPAEEADVA